MKSMRGGGWWWCILNTQTRWYSSIHSCGRTNRCSRHRYAVGPYDGPCLRMMRCAYDGGKNVCDARRWGWWECNAISMQRSIQMMVDQELLPHWKKGRKLWVQLTSPRGHFEFFAVIYTLRTSATHTTLPLQPLSSFSLTNLARKYAMSLCINTQWPYCTGL